MANYFLTRSLLVIAAIIGVGSTRSSACAEELKSGVQTWTLRNLNFDQMVKFAIDHHIKYLELIPNHIDPWGSMDEIKRKKDILEKSGLVAYTFGVAKTSLDEEENRKLFEFAKLMGMKLVVVEPLDFKIFDNLEELAKEYDIKVAIHNHGLKSLYGNPLVVKNIIKYRDARIGVCLDTGWVASGRYDVIRTFEEYEGRVFDVHLKDKKVISTPRGDDSHDTFIGEGDANLRPFLKALEEAHYNGVVAVETDNDLKDPTEHMVKALKFIEENK